MTRVQCRVLNTLTEQVIGLMFSRRVVTPLLFVLPEPRRFVIHSLFCPPFDAVFLDANCRVIDVFAVTSIRFWIQPRREALYLIEGPPGFGSGLKEGQFVKVDLNGAWLEIN